jgi:uncharacterized protein
MDTDTTRRLVQAFVEARARNDADALNAILADDAVWQPPVSSGLGPFNGREKVTKALSGGVQSRLFDLDTMRRDVHKIVVDGDTGIILQRLSATTVEGKEYVNEYCWAVTCVDGKISRLDEYADTLHASRILGGLLKPR